MTIFNTNPAAGGGGGDFNFIEDAPVGTYSYFPKSVIEGHPKWRTGFSGSQLVPFGTYPEVDPITDFHVPETTFNTFWQSSAAVNDLAGVNTFCYAEGNDFYKVGNTTPQQILKSVYDRDTFSEVESVHLNLINLNRSIDFHAAINDAETEMIYISSNSLYHYDIINNVETQIVLPDLINQDECCGMRWDNNLNKFVLLHYSSSNTLKVFTIVGTTPTLEGTHAVGIPVRYMGAMDKNGSKVHVNGKYYFSDRGNKKLYSISTTDFTVLNDEYTLTNATQNYLKNACVEGNTILVMNDYDFTNKRIIMTYSTDAGQNWNEKTFIQSSAPTSQAPPNALMVAADYVLVPHLNGSGASQSKIYRIHLNNNANLSTVYSSTVNHAGLGLDNGSTVAVNDIGDVFVNSYNNDLTVWRRDFEGGEGLTFPDLTVSENPDQFILAFKHTT